MELVLLQAKLSITKQIDSKVEELLKHIIIGCCGGDRLG
jgi:hypothetical protein